MVWGFRVWGLVFWGFESSGGSEFAVQNSREFSL